MKTFQEYLEEEAPATSVASGNVDMNTNGMPYKKRDKRKREDCEQMYRRALGLSGIKHLIGK